MSLCYISGKIPPKWQLLSIIVMQKDQAQANVSHLEQRCFKFYTKESKSHLPAITSEELFRKTRLVTGSIMGVYTADLGAISLHLPKCFPIKELGIDHNLGCPLATKPLHLLEAFCGQSSY